MSRLAPFESSIAERYHEETKYSEEGLRREAAAQAPLDWERQPAPFRRVEGVRRLLPTEGLPLVRRGAEAAPSGAASPAGPLARLARLLWHTNGCTRIVEMGGGVHHFRAAPSAGAMYPTEVYVAARGLEGIEDGVHDYQVLDHSLVRLRGGDVWTALSTACFGHPAVAAAKAVAILTGVWQRSAWRYRERGYRRTLLDTGHVLGNLVESAPGEGLRAFPLGCFRDELVERILDVDPVDEGPLVVVPLVGTDLAAGVPPLPLHGSETTEWHAAVAALGDRIPAEEPRRLSTALHIATRLGPDARPVTTPPAAPVAAEKDAAVLDAGAEGTSWTPEEPVTATIAERRSTRTFRPGELPRDALFRALAHAYPRDEFSLFVPSLLRTYVVAVSVVGVPHGTYVYDPAAKRLVELSRGRLAKALHHLGLGQEIFVNAGAAVIHTADLPRAVARYGDRVYRLLGLDAGHVGERLNLAILREGLGVSGCGGYFDDEMNRVLRIPESQAVVYITSIGIPADD